MIKTFITAALVACAAFASPAMAEDFTGVRAEVTAGTDIDRIAGLRTTDISYGAAVGLDAPFLGDDMTIGVEATVDNVFDYRDIGASVRLGVKVTDSVLVYGKAGYTDFRGLDGVRVGGGVEVALNSALYAKTEYRYSDLGSGLGRHQALVGLGLRF